MVFPSRPVLVLKQIFYIKVTLLKMPSLDVCEQNGDQHRRKCLLLALLEGQHPAESTVTVTAVRGVEIQLLTV